jgi:type IX secretion system PorP/SprF family membrane protein
MGKHKYKFLLLIMGLLSFGVQAQDAQFAQFFTAPMYMNPAFTGGLEYDVKDPMSKFRYTFQARSQWNNYRSTLASVDYFNKKRKIGLGIQALRTTTGNRGVEKTEVGFSGSYKTPIIEGLNFHSGIMLSVANQSPTFRNMTFTDQFNDDRFLGTVTIDNINLQPSIFYYDISAGGIIFNEKFWAGGSLYHINRPNVSMIGDMARLPWRISLHGGYKYHLKTNKTLVRRKRDRSIMPNVQYRMQGKFDQLDIGCYYTNEPFLLGMWYRGLPLKQAEDLRISQDALVFMVGYKFFGLKIGYSYDIPLTRLGFNFGGAHEISFAFQPLSEASRKKRTWKSIPMPAM